MTTAYEVDPDGNDLELCWDRPLDEWPRDEQGYIAFAERELDLNNLLAELSPPGTST